MKLVRHSVVEVLAAASLVSSLVAIRVLVGPAWDAGFELTADGGKVLFLGFDSEKHAEIVWQEDSVDPLPRVWTGFQSFALEITRVSGQSSASGLYHRSATYRLPWTTFAGIALLFGILPLRSLIRGPLRTRYRRRRGLCLKCGYNLTGNLSGVCPECGTALATPSAKVEDDYGPSSNGDTPGT